MINYGWRHINSLIKIKNNDDTSHSNKSNDTMKFDVIFGDLNYSAVVDYPACCAEAYAKP